MFSKLLSKTKSWTYGISKRWLITTFGALIPIFVILVVLICVSISSALTATIEQSLSDRVNELSHLFPGFSCETSQDFNATSIGYLEDGDYSSEMRIEAISSSGEIIATSKGYEADEKSERPDFNEAMENEDGIGKWTGHLSTGEKVLTETKVAKNSQGTPIGAIRCIISLNGVGGTVFLFGLIATLIGIAVIAIIAISGSNFLRSIIEPVHEMNTKASEIAQGNFGEKLTKKYDDEIGELSDSINQMSEELDASEKMKADFISRVSHELRTPLTSIRGWAETLRGGQLDRITFDKGINIIINESARLKSLVEELLDFSKMQSGRLVLNMQKLDMLAEIGDVVLMFNERAKSEGKHLIYDEDPDKVLPAIYGDSNKLKQVFINVIDNAIKYTPTGGMIGIQVYRDFKDDMIKVVVADNGCGISPEDLPKITNKFYKANQKVDGSGIGLAVAKEIVNLHKGTLETESSLDVGTTVTIGIPIYRKHLTSSEDMTPGV